ncbi:MAG: toll/interleukin-1 receptor domain-containing protein, partial [Nitrososphaerales archaeon]
GRLRGSTVRPGDALAELQLGQRADRTRLCGRAPVPTEFTRAVQSSRYTVLVLSPAFLADRWLQFGDQLASFARVEGRNRLIPIDLQPVELPLHLEFLVRLDATDQAGWPAVAGRLREILDRPEPVEAPIPCPYPGLARFTEDDAGRFYGREKEIAALRRPAKGTRRRLEDEAVEWERLVRGDSGLPDAGELPEAEALAGRAGCGRAGGWRAPARIRECEPGGTAAGNPQSQAGADGVRRALRRRVGRHRHCRQAGAGLRGAAAGAGPGVCRTVSLLSRRYKAGPPPGLRSRRRLARGPARRGQADLLPGCGCLRSPAIPGPYGMGDRHGVQPGRQTALSGSTDGTLRLWQTDTLEDLIPWVRANRYVPELPCDTRALPH